MANKITILDANTAKVINEQERFVSKEAFIATKANLEQQLAEIDKALKDMAEFTSE